ncbi:hypothetical protein, partial [Flavobacterium sp.]|uniref:hypothetical protein n=1 Tax=Flavobacterium sp. TaxID=239 RepID=UPI002EDA1126
NIKEESAVFCGSESVDKLRATEKGEFAFENWDKEKLKKFNFFTSRFFTAFDMILDVKPNVLILSDVKTAKHSALDPNTDIIQIIGRARKGVNHIAHITNWEASLTNKTEAEIRAFLDGSNQAYFTIKQLRDTTNQPGAYHAYDEALKLISFSRFIDPYTNLISHFMIDNEIHANQVNGYYKSSAKLEQAYAETERFKINHIKERYNLEDGDIKDLEKGISEKRVMQYVCETIHKHFEEQSEIRYTLHVNHEFNKFISTHGLKYRYYREIGIEKIRELGYSPVKISALYNKIQIEKSPSFLHLQLSLLSIFKSGRTFSTQKIISILNYLFKRHNVILSPTLTQLKEWFSVTRTTVGYTEDGREIKHYRINNCLNSLEMPKFRN